MSDELDPNIIGMCTECKSPQPQSYMVKSPFAQQGDSPPCKYCGGVVTVLDVRDAENAKAQMDRQRGIDQAPKN